MHSSDQTYADAYNEQALRILLDTTQGGFHALVYRASRNGDLDFLERALTVLKPTQMKVEIRQIYLYDTLTFIDGAEERVSLPAETLFASFLRGLRGREFDAREEAFLSALLAKAISGNPSVPAPHIYGEAISRLMNYGTGMRALDYLLALGPTPDNNPSATPIKAAGREMFANALGMSIVTGNETAFSGLIERATRGKSPNELEAFWKTAPAIQAGYASSHTQETYNILAAVLFYAEPDRVESFIRICQQHAPMSTATIDTTLESYLNSCKEQSDKVIGYEGHWARPLNESGWNDNAVTSILSHRDQSATFPDSLLITSMSRACHHVLQAALRAGQTDLTTVRRARNPHVKVNVAKTIAASLAPLERISLSLTAAIAGGANIDQYSEDTTALIEAAKNGRLDVAGVLLEHGADPTATDARNWKPASSFKDKTQRAKFEQMISSLKAKKSVEAVLKAKFGATP